MSEPLGPDDARRAVRKILQSGGSIAYSGHALRRMAERSVTQIDVVNVLRGGWCEGPEWESGSWRHTVCTQKLRVVVVIEVEDGELTVVTVIRVERLR